MMSLTVKRLFVCVLAMAAFGPAVSLAKSTGSSGGGLLGGLSGSPSIAFAVGTANPPQDDLNSSVDSINGTSGRNATKLGSGLEFSGQLMFRATGASYAFLFRPSYLTQSASGATDSISITGMMFFPMLRFYPLESDIIHFFMQLGVGYGTLTGKITQPGGTVGFTGSAFGANAGLGAEFSLTGSQSIFLEGNFRYLPIDRNLVTSSYSNPATGFSQTGAGQELEANSHDVATSLSGFVGSIGYQIQF